MFIKVVPQRRMLTCIKAVPVFDRQDSYLARICKTSGSLTKRCQRESGRACGQGETTETPRRVEIARALRLEKRFSIAA
jgi:hypothetical protein